MKKYKEKTTLKPNLRKHENSLFKFYVFEVRKSSQRFLKLRLVITIC